MSCIMSLSLIAATAAAGTATQQVQHVIDKTLPVLIDAVGTEPDEECCMAAITGAGAILLASGPIACQSYVERIAQAMHAVRSGGDCLPPGWVQPAADIKSFVHFRAAPCLLPAPSAAKDVC